MTQANNEIAKAAIEAWLDEFEGFACRADRLGEDAATGRPLEPWLREAFKMGFRAGRDADGIPVDLGTPQLPDAIGSKDE